MLFVDNASVWVPFLRQLWLRYQLILLKISEVPLVEWNAFHRCFIDTSNTEILKQFITNNHCWPIEIYLFPKVINVGKAKKKNAQTDALPLHLMAFPNVGRLLYPGGRCSFAFTTMRSKFTTSLNWQFEAYPQHFYPRIEKMVGREITGYFHLVTEPIAPIHCYADESSLW